MNNKKIRIFVACGSGIATSTMIQEKVKKFFERDSTITPEITKGNLNQVRSQDGKVDLILVTSNYDREIGTPLIQVTDLLTGINEEKKIKEIISLSEEIVGNKN